MPCYYLLDAWQREDGSITFTEKGAIKRQLQLPCGQCIGCRLRRSRDWAIRVMHESQMHEANSFVTLTYDDENLKSPSLIYRHFQLWMKRLRKSRPGQTIKYYMAGEYGEELGRPHFHACLFNVWFADREPLKRMPGGHWLYRSTELENLWTKGFSSVGDLTEESAAYVARYCIKKITGRNARDHYEIINPETGEITDREPEFNRMSLKPAIASNWFKKYQGDVFDNDYVILNGKKQRPPKYYDRLYAKANAFAAEHIKYLREKEAEQHSANNTLARLAARETVDLARANLSKRRLK